MCATNIRRSLKIVLVNLISMIGACIGSISWASVAERNVSPWLVQLPDADV